MLIPAAEIAFMVIDEARSGAVFSRMQLAPARIRGRQRNGADISTLIRKENAINGPLLDLSASHVSQGWNVDNFIALGKIAIGSKSMMKTR